MVKNKKQLVLAADVGGTKTEFGIFQIDGALLRPVKKSRFENRRYKGFPEVIEEFLKDTGASGAAGIVSAAFGVASPVENNFSRLTNLNWTIDAGRLKRRFKGIGNLELINDMVALSWGLPLLSRKDYLILQRGKRKKANAVLIAPGTGLGEGILFFDGTSHVPMASEGGHSDFAPRNDVEIELLSYLSAMFGHVSYERIVSGPGLKNIYDFLTGKTGVPESIRERFEKEEPSFVIADEARKGADAVSIGALEIFTSILGAEAGNISLKALAEGGVFIGGGIVRAITETLKKGHFINAFLDKGRFRGLLSNIPVYVILREGAALLGAANYARAMVKKQDLGLRGIPGF